MEVGVNRYHIDFAKFGIGGSVDFGPTKTHQPAVVAVQKTKAGSVEPGLGHGLANRIDSESAPFGMPVECPIVDLYESIDVVCGESASDQTGGTVGKRATQLPEIAVGHETQLRSDCVGLIIDLAQPELHGLVAIRREPVRQACPEIELAAIFSDDERPSAVAFIWSLDGQRHRVSVASDYGQATITEGPRSCHK